MAASKKKTQSTIEHPKEWNEKYTDDDKSKVRKIIDWINSGQDHEPGYQNQRSQTKLSRASKVSHTSLNQILRGKYPSPPTKQLDVLIDTIERDQVRENETLGDNPFVETSVYQMVKAACHRAHVYRNVGVVSCNVGTGKTWALKHYCAHHANAVLIEATPDMNPLAILREIAELTGAVITKSYKWARGTKADLMQGIIKHLKGTDTLLIIDEAETVTDAALQFVRRIGDKAHIGIVLSGTHYLMPMLRDLEGRFGQVGSRVTYWPAVIKKITTNDARMILDAALGDIIDIDDELHDAFYRVCDGSARVLGRALIPAVNDYGIKKGKEITPKLVFDIGEMLLGYKTARPKK